MERDIRDWGGNIVALVVVVLVNALANGLPLGGQSTGEVSAKYESLFTPAGYAFAIWGLIYLALFAFVIYQAGPRRPPECKTGENQPPMDRQLWVQRFVDILLALRFSPLVFTGHAGNSVVPGENLS